MLYKISSHFCECESDLQTETTDNVREALDIYNEWINHVCPTCGYSGLITLERKDTPNGEYDAVAEHNDIKGEEIDEWYEYIGSE